ncbi:TrbC/VirB2 family protein [Qipengyuania sp. DSG2-2]|uniref:TrbC/VirB2 family protein n=1 Tax=Qipengyuania sp. DGS2-2 TaxID=3349631 RepID=UPI0036D2C281
MALRSSGGDLFTAAGPSAVESAAAWIATLLTGSLAVTLSVLAVAIIGFLTLSGRFPVRESGRAILGVFLLLGASTLASALIGLAERGMNSGPAMVYSQPVQAERDLQPAEYDPYAGASLRRD